MRKTIFSLLLCLFLLSACAVPQPAPAGTPADTAVPEESPEAAETAAADGLPFRYSDMEEALALYEAGGDHLFVDVRTPDEYAQGHIPGAVNVPNDTIGEEPVPELPDLDRTLLVYCRTGVRSLAASEKLAAAGYTAVVDIGGILDWKGKTKRGWEP